MSAPISVIDPVEEVGLTAVYDQIDASHERLSKQSSSFTKDPLWQSLVPHYNRFVNLRQEQEELLRNGAIMKTEIDTLRRESEELQNLISMETELLKEADGGYDFLEKKMVRFHSLHETLVRTLLESTGIEEEVHSRFALEEERERQAKDKDNPSTPTSTSTSSSSTTPISTPGSTSHTRAISSLQDPRILQLSRHHSGTSTLNPRQSVRRRQQSSHTPTLIHRDSDSRVGGGRGRRKKPRSSTPASASLAVPSRRRTKSPTPLRPAQRLRNTVHHHTNTPHRRIQLHPPSSSSSSSRDDRDLEVVSEDQDDDDDEPLAFSLPLSISHDHQAYLQTERERTSTGNTATAARTRRVRNKKRKKKQGERDDDDDDVDVVIDVVDSQDDDDDDDDDSFYLTLSSDSDEDEMRVFTVDEDLSDDVDD